MQRPIGYGARGTGVGQRGQPAVQVKGVRGANAVAVGQAVERSERLIGQAGGHGVHRTGRLGLGGQRGDAAQAVAGEVNPAAAGVGKFNEPVGQIVGVRGGVHAAVEGAGVLDDVTAIVVAPGEGVSVGVRRRYSIRQRVQSDQIGYIAPTSDRTF